MRDEMASTQRVNLRRHGADGDVASVDDVIIEAPLAIRIAAGSEVRRLATTMRTPGHDDELAIGWLLAEGVITQRSDVLDVSRCATWEHDADGAEHDHDHANLVTVTLRRETLPDLEHLDRHGVMTSACGICGRASIDALVASGVSPVPTTTMNVDPAMLQQLPTMMLEAQHDFRATGGSHAAARFSGDGALLDLREDVGRHNALDKLIGAATLDGDVPLQDQILVLSSRASYELLVKAAVAGIPVVATVGAPTSLAIEVAEALGITLVTFLRGDRAGLHTNLHRLHLDAKRTHHG